MANMTVFNQHFDLLEETIDRLNLRNKPLSIFNCDEPMVAMDRRTGKVLVSRKTKQAYAETKGMRDLITVNAELQIIFQNLSDMMSRKNKIPSDIYENL